MCQNVENFFFVAWFCRSSSYSFFISLYFISFWLVKWDKAQKPNRQIVCISIAFPCINLSLRNFIVIFKPNSIFIKPLWHIYRFPLMLVSCSDDIRFLLSVYLKNFESFFLFLFYCSLSVLASFLLPFLCFYFCLYEVKSSVKSICSIR